MAGSIENTEHRAVAEQMKTALASLFPNNKLIVQYLERESLLAVDEHRIVARKTICGFAIPFSGKIIWRYGSGPCNPHCYVHDQKVYDVMKEKFFTPNLM